jgi:uncharacterized protein YciI
MYIIELTYCKPLDEVDLLLESHKAFLNKYYSSGNFLLSGRKNPRTGGVILANAANPDEIKHIISEDPFNRNGVANYSITEFFPTMSNGNLTFLLNA